MPATIWKCSSETWEPVDDDSLDLANISSLPETYYRFLDKESYPKSESARGDLLRHFDVPDFLYNKTCTDLNGYFGCRGRYNKEGELESYSTWFRCLVKMVKKTQFSELDDTADDEPEYTKSGKSYAWFEMGFFTRWSSPGHCKVLCIDTPKELQSKLNAVLRKQSPRLDFSDPFAMHVPLIEQIILLYDLSVWRARHPVREIEQNRLKVKPNFEKMHEISRHSIHISEVLSVTIETMNGIRRQQKAVYERLSPGRATPYQEQAQEYMSFQLQMVKSLKLRSDSNHERLKNEITLAYNIIAGQDNTVMKSIALLTMTFLPATFFSAFFSMTFFTFSDNGWKISKEIWVYMVITIPSTLLVLVIWSFWLRAQRLKEFFERRSPVQPQENSSPVRLTELTNQLEQVGKTEQLRQTEMVKQAEMV